MRLLLDLAYVLSAVVSLPVWLTRMIVTGKIRTDWPGRFGRVPERARADAEHARPTILIHAVSVGEVNASRHLAAHLCRRAPEPRIVISSTTDTGFARARAIFGQVYEVVRFPLDISPAVRRFLDAVRPSAVALIELEVWPNFTAACEQRGIPVCVVNGRLSERSARRYGWIRRLISPSFARLAFAAVQTEKYAERFRAMGVPADRVILTNTMKWDTAEIADSVPGAEELATDLGIDRARPLVVAGSTAPDEHRLLHEAVPGGVQLLCAPRKPEWFDRAAADLPGCARRSRGERSSATGRYLLDTIGELRRAYALADLVVVGRTFANYGGSDMIEPIALGKPTVIGPDVANFAETAQMLAAGGGLVQTTAERLAGVLAELLDDSDHRRGLAARGREVIRANMGASERNAELILRLLPDHAAGTGGATADTQRAQR